jgi:hypothetical protein
VYNIPEATKDVSLKKCRDMLEEDSITGIWQSSLPVDLNVPGFCPRWAAVPMHLLWCTIGIQIDMSHHEHMVGDNFEFNFLCFADWHCQCQNMEHSW